MDKDCEIAVLQAENAKQKKKIRELEHIRILNQSTIMNLRRQIEWFEVEHELEASGIGWIPVEEHLPDSGRPVLVTDGMDVGEGWLAEVINTKGHLLHWVTPVCDIDDKRQRITHWMPLPPTPKGGADNG